MGNQFNVSIPIEEMKVTGDFPSDISHRLHHSDTFLYNDKFYVFPGFFHIYTMHSFIKYIYCLDLKTKNWEKLETTSIDLDVNAERKVWNVSIVDDKMYIVDVKGVYSLHLDTLVWRCELTHSKDAHFPKRRFDHSCVVYNSSFIIYGGYQFGSNRVLDDIYEFNTLTKRWIRIWIPKSPRRAKHSCSLYKDMLIVFGGVDEDNCETNTLFTFDLKQLKWQLVRTFGNKPEKRYLHATCIVNDSMYIIGGYGCLSKSIYRLDLTTNTYHQWEDMHYIAYHSLFIYQGKIITFGGIDTMKMNAIHKLYEICLPHFEFK